jgi:hypothetical protein
MMQLMKLVTTLGVILLSGAKTVAGKELNFSMSINGMDAVGTDNNVVVAFVHKDGRELYRETRQGLERRWGFHIFRTGELSNEDIDSFRHIEVRVEGGDGLVIDYAWVEARDVFGPPSNEKIAIWGVFDEMGWCLSEDLGDANYGPWSGHLVADQCKPGYAFLIHPNKVVDISELLTMSCTGVNACSGASKYEISSNKSCRGDHSCSNASRKISSNSCWGDDSCRDADSAEISSNSCWGDESCRDVVALEVEEGSCHGSNSCSQLFLSNVGPSSCIGEGACTGSGIYSTKFNVQGGSCVGDSACSHPGRRVTIGKNSCNCDGCCRRCKGDAIVPAIVPDNACNQDENGVPVNADDFIDGKMCKYCLE